MFGGKYFWKKIVFTTNFVSLYNNTNLETISNRLFKKNISEVKIMHTCDEEEGEKEELWEVHGLIGRGV